MKVVLIRFGYNFSAKPEADSKRLAEGSSIIIPRLASAMKEKEGTTARATGN
jgi:hypothetical protein